jgi:hypothetical protein
VVEGDAVMLLAISFARVTRTRHENSPDHHLRHRIRELHERSATQELTRSVVPDTDVQLQVELGARGGNGGVGGVGTADAWDDSWGDDDTKQFEQTGYKSRQAKVEDSISSLFEEMCVNTFHSSHTVIKLLRAQRCHHSYSNMLTLHACAEVTCPHPPTSTLASSRAAHNPTSRLLGRDDIYLCGN